MTLKRPLLLAMALMSAILVMAHNLARLEAPAVAGKQSAPASKPSGPSSRLTPGLLADTSITPGAGGWNLGNVEVLLNGTQGDIGSMYSWFDPATGEYNFAPDSDFSYSSGVFDDSDTLMGIVLAKPWPIGEPSGVKVVNDDPNVKNGKPLHCIMSTSYLKGSYLDSTDPKQVICSSPFQSHKRYKVAMLPSTVDGLGSEGVDMVFNVQPELGAREYQVFQKINNWTNGRLQGFRFEVGFGVGAAFVSASDAGVDLADLNIAVPSDLWSPTQLAVFSAGLFGPLDKHTGEVGFFDQNKRAGFLIDEYVTGTQPLTDTLTATRTLESNYLDLPAGAGAAANQFGPWLPNNMLPQGIFLDDDGNPDTDATLVAWYGYNPATKGLGWMRGAKDAFGAVAADEIQAMGSNLSYTSAPIDDLVNLTINYLVRVGDVGRFPASAKNTFTIRVTPTRDTSGIGAPSYVGKAPPPLLYASSSATVLLQPEKTFAIGSLLTARVGDADLNQDPFVAEEVTVSISSSSGLSETLTLVEQGVNRGVFAATLPEAFSNVPLGTVVTMAYFDGIPALRKTSSTTAVRQPVPGAAVTITGLSVPASTLDRLTSQLSITVATDKTAPAPVSGTVLLTGSDGSEFTGIFTGLGPDKKVNFTFRWTARLDVWNVPQTVEWVASATVNDQLVDGVEGVTQVLVNPPKSRRR